MTEKPAPPYFREQPVRILLFAAWFGLIFGWGEAAIQLFRQRVLHEMLHISQYIPWTIPLADTVYFLVLGILLLLLILAIPRLGRRQFITFCFLFAGFSMLFFVFNELSKYAALLLAAGLAFQLTRMIVKRFDRFQSLVKRSLVWMVALLAVLAISQFAWRYIAETRQVASLPPADPEMPNVILIVMDTVRAQNLSLYGYERRTTPNLERIAQEGVTFTRPISTSPWTLPSHASIFTGRLPDDLDVDWSHPLDTTYPTLAEFLGKHGYRTAGFTANTIFTSYETGINRGFVHYEDYDISPGRIIFDTTLARWLLSKYKFRNFINYYDEPGRKNAAKVNMEFHSWLEKSDRKPFFAFINYFDAHDPYLPPSPFDKLYGSQEHRDIPEIFYWSYYTPPEEYLPSEQIQAEIDAYDGAITYLDQKIGELIDTLEKQGMLNYTVLIIASDHGEQLGNHNLIRHGSSVYLASVYVPLIIIYPSRIPEATTAETPVSLKDLPATVLDLLNIQNEGEFPGKSLAMLWESHGSGENIPSAPVYSETTFEPTVPEWFPNSKGAVRSLLDQEFHYILNCDGSQELYEYPIDPWEEHDLSNQPENSGLLEQYKAQLPGNSCQPTAIQ